MAAILLVVHEERAEAHEVARRTADRLTGEGHTVGMVETDAVRIGRPDLGAAPPPAARWDLAISIGGDGTMLRTVDLVSDHDVPVLGVNLGQLGYLVETQAADLDGAMRRFLSGDHAIEERMRLEVRVEGTGQLASALNEAVLEKTAQGHTVRLAASVDGEHFATFTADGLIVATPTGSTAYALSARAPIVSPTHRALVLTPVAPHMLFDRSLVVEPEAVLRLEVRGWRPAALLLDGRHGGMLEEGDAIVCGASPHPARLVTFGRHSFLGVLRSKFGLNDR